MSLELENKNKFLARINFKNLNILSYGSKEIRPTDIEAVLKIVQSEKQGRMTIRGPNGSGKSSVLTFLKETLPLSFYLPATHQLIFDSTYNASLSMGEKKKKEIEEIELMMSNSAIRFLLLDEWDANLDQSNIQIIDRIIERLSQQINVIEVRHRDDAVLGI